MPNYRKATSSDEDYMPRVHSSTATDTQGPNKRGNAGDYYHPEGVVEADLSLTAQEFLDVMDRVEDYTVTHEDAIRDGLLNVIDTMAKINAIMADTDKLRAQALMLSRFIIMAFIIMLLWLVWEIRCLRMRMGL